MRPASPQSAPSGRRWRKVALLVLTVALTYGVFELVYGWLYVHGVVSPPASLWIFEAGDAIQFDPIRGYRLSTVPARHARITYGTPEYVGVLRGNAQGFPDQDFAPPRDPGGAPRIAVFGDSFTAGQFFERSWPSEVEALARRDGSPLDLLNFSIDGGGLANWWSVLTRFVAPEGYELDGLVFAPIESDLNRTFTVAEHRGQTRHMLGRSSSWKPEAWPRTEADAAADLRATDGYLLSAEAFDAALRGASRPDLPRPWALHGAAAVGDLLARASAVLRTRAPSAGGASRGTPPPRPFVAAQLRLIEDVAAFARARSLPVLVVRIPLREEVLRGLPPSPRMREFADLLGADFVDGSEAFAGLTESEVRASWFPYDGHWSQQGSDRFAAFMEPVLRRWTRSSTSSREARPADG